MGEAGPTASTFSLRWFGSQSRTRPLQSQACPHSPLSILVLAVRRPKGSFGFNNPAVDTTLRQIWSHQGSQRPGQFPSERSESLAGALCTRPAPHRLGPEGGQSRGPEGSASHQEQPNQGWRHRGLPLGCGQSYGNVERGVQPLRHQGSA